MMHPLFVHSHVVVCVAAVVVVVVVVVVVSDDERSFLDVDSLVQSKPNRGTKAIPANKLDFEVLSP